jgi:hypothetical protein
MPGESQASACPPPPPSLEAATRVVEVVEGYHVEFSHRDDREIRLTPPLHLVFGGPFDLDRG